MEPDAGEPHLYTVMISDNFHHMDPDPDENEAYKLAEFDNCAAALLACRQVVDEFLLSTYGPEMTAQELRALYMGFGDDPYIVSADYRCKFAAWEYARQRCEEICKPDKGEGNKVRSEMDDTSENEQLIDTWRRIIVGGGKSWVVFEHGTCVILTRRAEEVAAEATALLKEWGPVVVGTPAGDFNVVKLQDEPGWVVTCHHPDILTYVGADEFAEGHAPEEMMIGLIGRAKRGQDAEELRIIHTEP